ncbi:MAG: hypothetical protein AAB526_02740 [Patescibacteria group bacterium]
MRIFYEAIHSYLYVLPRGTLKKELLGYIGLFTTTIVQMMELN